MGEQAEELNEELEAEATGDELENDAGGSEEPGDTEEPGELPLWQKEDDEPETTEQVDGKGVPIPKYVELKRKLRGEQAQRTAADEENERLKQELAEMRKPKTEVPKRPRAADFDTDEEHEDALDKYEADRLLFLQTATVQSSEEKERVQRRRQQVAAAVDGHYDRAAKLLEDSSINPEVYKKAEDDVKALIDSIIPGAGENVFAGLVETIGEGSEKVLFYAGRNRTGKNEFAAALREDPTGLKAAAYLGRMAERFSGAKGQGSRAPAPATQLKGDGAVSAQASGAKKKWDAAHKKGDVQAAYNIKSEARSKGIDTSGWR
jgi:hypothetical protein